MRRAAPLAVSAGRRALSVAGKASAPATARNAGRRRPNAYTASGARRGAGSLAEPAGFEQGADVNKGKVQ
jgi:hypothetical protein